MQTVEEQNCLNCQRLIQNKFCDMGHNKYLVNNPEKQGGECPQFTPKKNFIMATAKIKQRWSWHKLKPQLQEPTDIEEPQEPAIREAKEEETDPIVIAYDNWMKLQKKQDDPELKFEPVRIPNELVNLPKMHLKQKSQKQILKAEQKQRSREQNQAQEGESEEGISIKVAGVALLATLIIGFLGYMSLGWVGLI